MLNTFLQKLDVFLLLNVTLVCCHYILVRRLKKLKASTESEDLSEYKLCKKVAIPLLIFLYFLINSVIFFGERIHSLIKG